jgi:hypothetical protein
MSTSGFGGRHLAIPLPVGSDKVEHSTKTNRDPENIRFEPEIMLLSSLGAEIRVLPVSVAAVLETHFRLGWA